jgi:hypothetical protein
MNIIQKRVNGKLVEHTVDGIDQLTIGAGDVIYKVAQPIAKVIDKMFHTSIAGCGGCQKRRKLLNRIRFKH